MRSTVIKYFGVNYLNMLNYNYSRADAHTPISLTVDTTLVKTIKNKTYKQNYNTNIEGRIIFYEYIIHDIVLHLIIQLCIYIFWRWYCFLLSKFYHRWIILKTVCTVADLREGPGDLNFFQTTVNIVINSTFFL